MTHSKLRGLRGIAAALGLGLTLAWLVPAQALAAGHGGKKKPVAAQKVAASKAQRRAHASASRQQLAHTAERGKGSRKAALHAARAMKGHHHLAARAVTVAGAGAVAAGGAHALAHDDAPLRLSANAALVVDQNSREVLFSKNDRAVLPIASLTKLMTGLLVADAKLPLDEEITITEEDVDTYKGTGSRLAIGMRLTRGELMHIALMSSENRAANALGRTYPGGLGNFVRLMNQKAAELGMRDTRYVEPTGLSVENRSSAHDLALLVAAAYQRPLLRELSTSTGYTVEAGRRVLQYRNSNRLIDDPKWDIGLQKTGYIAEAGRCMVMSARLAGRQVIMIFLDAADKAARIGDAQRVRRWVESASHAERPELAAFRRG
ncbi:MAG: hypothetical protein RJA36_2172 [Pseudomonadota bacterium]|jgi:D-alanyl-D-alanine endopeptidase (penicillin-binding protein 7)